MSKYPEKTLTEVPRPGEKYEHTNGISYEIVCLAKDAAADELLVIHKSLPPYGDGAVWSRSVGNFMGLRNGVARFRKLT